MKNYLIIILVTFFSTIFFAQDYLPFEVNSKEYYHLKKANKDFEDGAYEKAATQYDSCTIITQYFPLEQYKQSIALYMTKDSVKAKVIFYNAVKNGLTFFYHDYFSKSPLIKELSYNSQVYDLVKSRCYSDSLCLFQSIRTELIELRKLDQGTRGGSLDSLPMAIQDSLNQIELKKIIAKIGWPGFNEVGRDGENVSFLIAQHSDNDLEFQKECLELMKVEYLKGNVSKNFYSLIIDRQLVNNGKKQIFGSQVTYDEKLKKIVPEPCDYPEEVNFLRNLHHLGDIEPYLKKMQDKI